MTAPVWAYWEGPQPDYIAVALRTIATHCPGHRLLDRAAFEALRTRDCDIDLDKPDKKNRFASLMDISEENQDVRYL